MRTSCPRRSRCEPFGRSTAERHSGGGRSGSRPRVSRARLGFLSKVTKNAQKNSRYCLRAFIAWMTSSVPSSHSKTDRARPRGRVVHADVAHPPGSRLRLRLRQPKRRPAHRRRADHESLSCPDRKSTWPAREESGRVNFIPCASCGPSNQSGRHPLQVTLGLLSLLPLLTEQRRGSSPIQG